MSYSGMQPTYGTFPSDLFTANGSNTVFTLSSVPGNKAALLVSIDGVRQQTDAYSYSANTITFSEAPANGSVIEAVNMGSRADVVVTDGVYRKTQFTATAAQTNFNIANGYTVGFVDVYLNGIRLVGADDFTANDGSTVILAVAAAAGDSVEVVAYGTFNVANALQKSGDTMSGNLVVSGTSTFNAPVAIANTSANTVVFANTGVVTFNANTTHVGAATFSNTLTAASGVTFNDASIQTTAASGFGFKNRIINGDMRIDQRNAGGTLSLATVGGFLWAVDRFAGYVDKSGITGTVGQSTDAPPGFVSSFAVSITTGAASAAGDQSLIHQGIEGTNVSDLGWGTAAAQPVTLSFWVKSSITGINGASITNSAANRCYIAAYTVNAANTWEYKSITIPGDTTGTWLTTTGMGIRVRWNIGSGASYLGTSGSWGATYYSGPTGSFSTTATSGASFKIAGVQLEKGSTATSFDYRPYGYELALCQRYYEKSYDYSTTPGTATSYGMSFFTTAFGAGTYNGNIKFKIEKRAGPTMAYWDAAGTANKCTYAGGTWYNGNAAAGISSVTSGAELSVSGQSGYAPNFVQWTATSEL
jgi:hypothetical protein